MVVISPHITGLTGWLPNWPFFGYQIGHKVGDELSFVMFKWAGRVEEDGDGEGQIVLGEKEGEQLVQQGMAELSIGDGCSILICCDRERTKEKGRLSLVLGRPDL
jgi:hypothetical protein